MRGSREDKLIRQLRSEEEKKALSRMAEIAEAGGFLTTAKDLNDVIIALRVTGKKFDPELIREELERAGWISQVEGKVVIKKAIPLSTLRQFLQR